MIEKVFGDRLNELRKKSGLSLSALGEEIGATKSAIGNMEHGRKKPSLDMVIALADYFGVSIDYLIGRSDDPTRH